MRIERRAHGAPAEEFRADLGEAAQASGVKGRVCGAACAKTCSECGSTACQCQCVSTCPDAPRALSCDPGRQPLEIGIVPLVFEMKRLGMFQPCWSCEGHANPDGSLSKPPRVWFYCDSMVHVRLFANVLSSLQFARKLHVPWQIAVTFSDPDNPATAFSVEPVLSPGTAFSLGGLQADASVIAKEFRTLMQWEARQLLDMAPPL